jgi:hypothetical protein
MREFERKRTKNSQRIGRLDSGRARQTLERGSAHRRPLGDWSLQNIGPKGRSYSFASGSSEKIVWQYFVTDGVGQYVPRSVLARLGAQRNMAQWLHYTRSMNVNDLALVVVNVIVWFAVGAILILMVS